MRDHHGHPSAFEEQCRFTECNNRAVHKVLEEVYVDGPMFLNRRHPYTTYVCCLHFGQIMGHAAELWCDG
jgi:hypothetical protein